MRLESPFHKRAQRVEVNSLSPLFRICRVRLPAFLKVYECMEAMFLKPDRKERKLSSKRAFGGLGFGSSNWMQHG